MCKAKKHGTAVNMADATEEAAWQKPENTRSLQDYIDSLERRFPSSESWNPLTKICGFHTHSFFEDQLHCDCLGVRAHSNGSTLLLLVKDGVWGELPSTGSWDEKLDVVLAQAYNHFGKWCLDHNEQNTQSIFRCLSLSMHKMGDYPLLKAKGHNSIVISKWLLDIVSSRVDGTPESFYLHGLLWGLDQLWNIPHDVRPRFIYTDGEVEQLRVARKIALLSFYALHERYSDTRTPLFNLIPKFHQFEHLQRRQIRSKIACWVFWCFSSEHAIGTMAKMCANTHGASTNSRSIQRWVVYFWATRVAR